MVEAAEGTLDGISYLHSEDVAHSDLKLSNLLVNDKVIDNSNNVVINLCDFGES